MVDADGEGQHLADLDPLDPTAAARRVGLAGFARDDPGLPRDAATVKLAPALAASGASGSA